MKLLILSDIHSNLYSLEAIVHKERDSDVMYCAGDLVDVGFHPQEVIDCIQANNMIAVRGNHDEIVIRAFRSGKHLEDLPPHELTWPIVNARQLNEASIAFLERLPAHLEFEADGIAYSMQHLFHGYDTIDSRHAFMDFWNRQTGGRPVCGKEKRLIFGHTHKQCVAYFHSGCLWMNPGSVGYNRPEDPSIAAHYITITDGRIELHWLEHARSLSRQDMSRRFAEVYQKTTFGKEGGSPLQSE
ncbi:metallophosphoesterase family protein [Paenibacillus sp.]|uniref:metallophosphoesterase family protein n=1 Tax=Paenibacillus sp. TaxID=58172 RepID=UPI002D75F8D7|nr:metallophosphoesterase family protein [Paenibacillus sp.]HZG58831.1 metallophosphoesterase family protein [Paenibacillus sp.]